MMKFNYVIPLKLICACGRVIKKRYLRHHPKNLRNSRHAFDSVIPPAAAALQAPRAQRTKRVNLIIPPTNLIDTHVPKRTRIDTYISFEHRSIKTVDATPRGDPLLSFFDIDALQAPNRGVDNTHSNCFDRRLQTYASSGTNI